MARLDLFEVTSLAFLLLILPDPNEDLFPQILLEDVAIFKNTLPDPNPNLFSQVPFDCRRWGAFLFPVLPVYDLLPKQCSTARGRFYGSVKAHSPIRAVY
jgi:hypothetical protein